MAERQASAGAASKKVFATKGGQTYLDNLERLYPDEYERVVRENKLDRKSSARDDEKVGQAES